MYETQNAEKGKKAPNGEIFSPQSLLEEINCAAMREKDYRKEAVEVLKIYEGLRHKTEQYNILYSNVDTTQPALYNSTPKPRVAKRFKGEADVRSKAAANLMQRLLTALVEAEDPRYATFDELMVHSTLSALLVSRGLVRFKYHAELGPAPIPETVEGVQPTEPQEVIQEETVYGEQVPWNSVLFGYAKYWKDVPWVAFIHLMTPAEFKEAFPGAKVDIDKLKASYGSDSSTSDKETGDSGSPSGTGALDAGEVRGLTLIPVYELWHKKTKKVYFVSEFCDDWLKAPAEDPLELRGFFPCPRPLNFMQRVSSMVPTLLYTMYKEQSEELNRITVRIQKLIVALKVRGAYDANIPELAQILSSDDNVMTPITDAAVLYTMQGSIEKALWLVPIRDIVTALQQLYVQRQQIKQIIFEITGLADIMRGSTQASETLGAQEIKNQWGTLRLKRSQRLVQRYVRDCLRIFGEIAVTKLQPTSIREITQSDLPSMQEKQIAQQEAAQAQQRGQPPNPEVLAKAQMPSFEECLELLTNDLTRNFRIDIETDSTIEAEATEDKRDMTEALTALSQAMGAIGPLVQQQILPFEAAKAIMLAVAQKFHFGSEIETQINLMRQPAPPQEEGKAPAGPTPEQVEAESAAATKKAEAEMQATTLQMQEREREHYFHMQEMQRKDELDAAKHQRALAELAMKASMPRPAAAGQAKPNPAQPTKRS